MKKLDILSQIELGTISFLAGAVVFGLPAVLAFFVIEHFLPGEWPSLVRYAIAAGGALLVWVLSIPAALAVEESFPTLRRILRKRPLNDVIADVERANTGNTFVAELEPAESDRRRRAEYSWVAKYQLVAAVVLVTGSIHYWNTAEGWSGPAVGIVGIAIAYSIIAEILRRVDKYTEEQRQAVETLRQQLAAFVCAVHDGTVERAEMARLRAAILGKSFDRPRRHGRQLRDDWVLISRAWAFWQDSFDEQDWVLCANCGAARQQHDPDGRCPRQD